jgi:hypothetical protein
MSSIGEPWTDIRSVLILRHEASFQERDSDKTQTEEGPSPFRGMSILSRKN